MVLQSYGWASWWFSTYCVKWCDLDPIQGQGHGAFSTVANNCTFLALFPPPLSRDTQNWWLVVIVWDLVYSLSEPDFSNFLLRKLSWQLKFHEIQMAIFGSAWHHSQMVGHAGNSTGIVHADMTLTRSKVKVTGLLNFRQLAKSCMLAAMTAAPLWDFLVVICP